MLTRYEKDLRIAMGLEWDALVQEVSWLFPVEVIPFLQALRRRIMDAALSAMDRVNNGPSLSELEEK